MVATANHTNGTLEARTERFYRRAIAALRAANVPFLTGGAYALAHYTRIVRHTKDLDIFVSPGDTRRVLDILHDTGYRTEMTFTHWLGKAFCGTDFVDVIFSSGNGVAKVDEAWFTHAQPARFLGEDVLVCPVEEMIWSKAFVMERERYDGADIAHLIHATGRTLDWPRLLSRFGPHSRVLLAHLVLFGFIYPSERDVVPVEVMHELLGRLQCEAEAPPPRRRVCRGTLISRLNYVTDLDEEGFEDARLDAEAGMTAEQVEAWTQAGLRELAG
jgi:hypothetical protein